MSDKPIVVVTGSRKLVDELRVCVAFWNACHRASVFYPYEEYEWHHGGADGVDTIVDNSLRQLHIEPIKHRPDYKQFGREQAPHIRNNWMLRLAEKRPDSKVIAIWSGKPGGTSSVIHKAASKGLPVFVEVLSR